MVEFDCSAAKAEEPHPRKCYLNITYNLTRGLNSINESSLTTTNYTGTFVIKKAPGNYKFYSNSRFRVPLELASLTK